MVYRFENLTPREILISTGKNEVLLLLARKEAEYLSCSLILTLRLISPRAKVLKAPLTLSTPLDLSNRPRMSAKPFGLARRIQTRLCH